MSLIITQLFCMQKLISVIIPFYNVEKYIENCLENIINQTFNFNDVEIILVNDCSTDNSLEIVNQYKDRYPENIIVQTTNDNSGSGGKPRNIGIEKASGKYLMFSDADDFFDINAFKVMYNKIEQTNADFIISNWIYTDEKGTNWKKPLFDQKRFIEFKLDIKDYDKSFYVMNSSMCNKIFNREFIINNKIKCLENMPGEDTYFTMTAFLESKNVHYIKDVTYYYRQRNRNKSSSSWDCTKKFFLGMNTAYKELYKEFSAKNEIQFYRFLYARNLTYLLYRFIDSNLINHKDRIEILEELHWFFELSTKLKVSTHQEFSMTLLEKIIDKEYEEAIDICYIISEIRKELPEESKIKMAKPYEEMYRGILENNL